MGIELSSLSGNAANELTNIFAALNKTSFKDGSTVNKNNFAPESLTNGPAVKVDSQKIENHIAMMNKLQEAILDIKDGGNVLPDVDAARLKALDVQQQLSVQSSAIANQSSDSILSLF